VNKGSVTIRTHAGKTLKVVGAVWWVDAVINDLSRLDAGVLSSIVVRTTDGDVTLTRGDVRDVTR
jgi:hypothetical protein